MHRSALVYVAATVFLVPVPTPPLLLIKLRDVKAKAIRDSGWEAVADKEDEFSRQAIQPQTEQASLRRGLPLS